MITMQFAVRCEQRLTGPHPVTGALVCDLNDVVTATSEDEARARLAEMGWGRIDGKEACSVHMDDLNAEACEVAERALQVLAPGSVPSQRVDGQIGAGVGEWPAPVDVETLTDLLQLANERTDRMVEHYSAQTPDVDQVADLRRRLTMTVPEAGKALGLGRDAAYAAVERGEIPAIKVGRRLVVPTHKLLAMLGID